MDSTQLLLTIVLTISTIFLVIICIQLILVLKEFRLTLKKINGIIGGFESIGLGLEHGVAEVAGFINGFRTILKTVDILGHHKDEKK